MADRHRVFEDAVATCNLLPGPASTQLAIFCAWRVAGPVGAVVGGAASILPGLAAILALAAVFLGSPPDWIRGAGRAQGPRSLRWRCTPASGWCRKAGGVRRRHWRWIRVYAALGGVAAATLGPWLVLVLIACGVVRRVAYVERGGTSGLPLADRRRGRADHGRTARVDLGCIQGGRRSYGGGFVIIPLMQADAIHAYHWMTNTESPQHVAHSVRSPRAR